MRPHGGLPQVGDSLLPLLVPRRLGAALVKTGTGNHSFRENTREFPEIITSTGAEFGHLSHFQCCTGHEGLSMTVR